MTSAPHLHELFELRPLTRGLLKANRRIIRSAEPNARPLPIFMLSRGVAGVVWGVRTDVPEDIVGELDRLARDEAPILDFEGLPLHAHEYQSLLRGRVSSGPAFGFPEVIDDPPGVTLVDRLDLLERYFRGWTAEEIPSCSPVMAVMDSGYPVSVCFCASGTSMPAVEAGVETGAAFRRRGFAARVTAAWARAIRAAGRTPVYTTDWTNAGSRGVARKLGLVQYASDWSLIEDNADQPARSDLR
jgi:hypothetical protein